MSESTLWENLPLDYIEDFIGSLLNVECNSWANWKKVWGKHMDFARTTVGEIVDCQKNRQTHQPIFEVYFEELDVVYNKLDLDYVLRYCDEVPLKYHNLSPSTSEEKLTKLLHLGVVPNRK